MSLELKKLSIQPCLFSILTVPPPLIEEELVKFIEEKTREQRDCEMWRALHIGRITSSMFGDVLIARDPPPKSLINQILYGSNLDK